MSSVITFWNNGKEQTGKTLSMVAIATHMAIEHNYKILVISTGYENKTLGNCFWKEKKTSKINYGIFGPNAGVGLADGLARMMSTNRINESSFRNYTKPVLTERLEVLQSTSVNHKEYEELQTIFPNIVALAKQAYDLVFVDLDHELGEDCINRILNQSDLIVSCISQRLTSINKYMEEREKKPLLKSSKALILIGRYDKYSNYSIKNISRYMKEKNKVISIPYNTLFFEACEEAKVIELFSKLRMLVTDDRNAIFVEEVKRASDSIIYRLQN